MLDKGRLLCVKFLAWGGMYRSQFSYELKIRHRVSGPPIRPGETPMRIRLAIGLALAVATLASRHSLYSEQSRQIGTVATATSSCTRATLAQPPEWTTTGAWSAGGDELMLADASKGTILRYSERGRFLGPIPDPFRSYLEPLSPTTLKAMPASDGSLIAVDGGRLLELDSGYRPLATFAQDSAPARVTSGSLHLGGPQLWEPVGKDIIEFAGIGRGKRDGTEAYSFGFVRYPVGNSAAWYLLKECGPYDRVTTFYRIGYQYMAAIGDTAYVVAMENPPTILRNEKGEHEFTALRATLPGLEKQPDLLAFTAKGELAPIMAAVEQYTMPVGLYSWENRLFLVARFAQRDGTRWEIWQLDPQNGEILSKARIPTTANHITVIPGPKSWAIVEKGPVTGWLTEDIKTALFIPSSAFQGPAGTMRGTLCRSIVESK